MIVGKPKSVEDETTEAFIRAINARMEESGISKKELARISGVSLRQIRSFLNGVGGSCYLSTADTIANALGVSVAEMLIRGSQRPSRRRTTRAAEAVSTN
jgi:transcriptional regulator with XRE-family HTH domain